MKFNIKNSGAAVILSAALIFASSCSPRADQASRNDNSRRVEIQEEPSIGRGSAPASERTFDEERADYRARLESTKNELNDRISELRQDARDGAEGSEARTDAEVNRLEQRIDNIDERMEKLSEVSEEEWSQFKREIDASLDEVENEFDQRRNDSRRREPNR
jgi:ElaB/YqjD/DUF883 family membrane-anchored ribosome-binding protein